MARGPIGKLRGLKRKAAAGGVLLAFFLAWLLLPGGGRRQGAAAPEPSVGTPPAPSLAAETPAPSPVGPPMGRTLDWLGAPVAGVLLCIKAGVELQRVLTDPEGRFLVPPETLETEWWSIETLDRRGAYETFMVKGGLLDPMLRLGAGRIVVAGRLTVEEAGAWRPVAGAELLFSTPGGRGERRALARTGTDADGLWTASLPQAKTAGELCVRALESGGRLLAAWDRKSFARAPIELVVRKSTLTLAVQPPGVLGKGSRLLVASAGDEEPPEIDREARENFAVRLSHGLKEIVLLDARGRLLAHERLRIEADQVLVFDLSYSHTALLSGRVRRPSGQPAEGFLVTLEPVRLQGASREPRPVSGWNTFLAAAAMRPVETDAEGAFAIAHGGLELGALRIEERSTGLFRRLALELPNPFTLEVVMRPLARLRLVGLETSGSAASIWPGALCWWILDPDGGLFDAGRIEAIPADLPPLEEGEWKLLLAHEDGSSACLRLEPRSPGILDVYARLEAPRNVRIEPGSRRFRIEWFGPGRVRLGGYFVESAASVPLPAHAIELLVRDERGNARRIKFPQGPPASLRLDG